MFFHKPDTSCKRLAGCYKRAKRLAAPGSIDLSHPLAAAWENCKMFLNSKKIEKNSTRDEIVDENTFDIVYLDWFAMRVDRFAENNMIDGDSTIASILHEWMGYLTFDPTRLTGAINGQR